MKVISTEHRMDGTHRWYRCPDCSARVRTMERVMLNPPERQQRGESNPSAVLTEDDVRRLRQRRRDGSTLVALAGEYGIARSTVASIVAGKSWSHVE
jgi:DNA-directed RNA polymerase subunit RPC12/RpoP